MMSVGFGMFIHLDAHSSSTETTLLQIIAGMGTGLSYTGPLLSLQAQVDSKDNATATSTWGFIRNLAQAISVVIGGVLFQNGMEAQSSTLRSQLGDSLAAKLSGKEAAANVMALPGLDLRMKEIASNAYASALKRMWILFACTAVASLTASLFLERKVLRRDHQVVEIGLRPGEAKTPVVLEGGEPPQPGTV